MRRADRLFQIIQILRHRELTTAAHLARRLEVSERTIYRDMRDLIASGVPVEGEAGVGYVLPRTFDLPPLMFTADEIEALVLGTRVVEERGDPGLAGAARSVQEKVAAVVPDELRERIDRLPLFSVSYSADVGHRLAALRGAVRDRRKVRFTYDARAQRVVRPLCLTLMMAAWLLSAWCELRNDFRTFRLDRMADLSVLDDTFDDEPERGLAAFFETFAREGC